MAPVDAHPLHDGLAPLVRDLRQHADARARVLPTFRIVRRGREQLQRPLGQPMTIDRVKILWCDGGPVRMSPDVVRRDQCVVPIERGVLDPLRLDRPGELLHLHGEAEPLPRLVVLAGAFRAARGQQHLPQIIEDRALHHRIAPPGFGDRGRDRIPIEVADAACADIGPIHWKTGGDLAQHLPAAVEGEIAVPAVAFGEPVQRVRQDIQLTRHRCEHDRQAASVRHLVERLRPASHPGVDATEFADVARIHEQPRHRGEKPVARRSGDPPVGTKHLVGRQDLLRHDMERPARELLEALEIRRGIEQAIRVVNPHARDSALIKESFQQDVSAVEDRGLLHAQSHELVDVDKAAVVDFVGRRAPVGQAIRLVLEQFVQPVKAGRIAGDAVDLADDRVDVAMKGRGRVDEARQPLPRNLLFAMPVRRCAQGSAPCTPEGSGAPSGCSDTRARLGRPRPPAPAGRGAGRARAAPAVD